MQTMQRLLRWGLILLVVPPLCGFWWWLGQGVSAQGVQFLTRTVRVQSATPYNLTLPASDGSGALRSNGSGSLSWAEVPSLSELNASNLTSGTVPVARLGHVGTPNPVTFLRGDNSWASPPSVALDDLDASNLTRGTVPVTRLGEAGTPSEGTFLRGDNRWESPTGMPVGAVIFVTTPACPTGWSEYTTARGRYLVGLAAGGTSGATTGQALSVGENRTVGRHTHGFSGESHDHSFRDSHGHSFSGSSHSHGLPSTNHSHSFSGNGSHNHSFSDSDNHSHATSVSSQHTHDLTANSGTPILYAEDGNDIAVRAPVSQATTGQSTGTTVGVNNATVQISGTTSGSDVRVSGTTGRSNAGSGGTNSTTFGGTVAGATVSGTTGNADAGGTVGFAGSNGTNAPYVQLLACQRS